MKKAIIVSMVLFSIASFSQQLLGDGFSVANTKQNLDFTRGYEKDDKSVLGKPYIVEVFLPATVVGYEGFFMMRYNAAKDEMEFEKEGKILHLIKSDSLLITFTSSKKQYRILNYNNEKADVKGYLVLLKENENISLYKKESIKLIPARDSSNAYGNEIPAHYESEKDTYYIKKDNSIKPFPKNKKEVIRIFPNSEKAIGDFLKSNDISFSKENDLIKLVNFLNTL